MRWDWAVRFGAALVCLGLLRPPPAYSEGSEDFVPPHEYNQEATSQKILGLKELFLGDDPIAAYSVLTYLALRAIGNLGSLGTQVPTALASAGDIWHYRTLRKDYLEHYERIQTLFKENPALFHALQNAATDHSDRLRDMEERIKMLERPGETNPHPAYQDRSRALLRWNEQRDLTGLDAWIAKWKGDPEFAKIAGPSWLKDFEFARGHEARTAKVVASRANAISDRYNKDLPAAQAMGIISTTDPSGNHAPGAFFQNGSGNGVIRITSNTLVTNAKERCEIAMTFLNDLNKLKGNKGGRFAPLGGLINLGLPVFTLGSAVVLTGLTARVWWLSFKRYGKDPSAAQQDIRHRNQVKNSMTVQGEASFSGQVAARETELKPLLDPIVEALSENKEAILEKAKEIAAKHGIEVDWQAKERMLSDPEALRYQVMQGLPHSAETIGRDLNFNQFLWFLSTAPKSKGAAPQATTFIDSLYGRTIDGIFPELGTDGSTGFKPLRAKLSKETMPKVNELNFPVPEGTPRHPAIPKDVPLPKKADAKGVSGAPQEMQPNAIVTGTSNSSGQ